MITKETATRIALAYREIEAAEKLIGEVAKEMDRFDQSDLRDAFGHRVRGLQLGVPSGEMSTRCFELPYAVAGPVIEAHISQQRAIIVALSAKALGEADALRRPAEDPSPFQNRIVPWMEATFGPEISGDREERNHRFLEEALELVQACGCTAGEAHQLVDYVYGRPIGKPAQEVGGVMVTLAALCLAHAMDMHDAGEVELARIWTKVEQIRAKQAAKPKHSPLPEGAP